MSVPGLADDPTERFSRGLDAFLAEIESSRKSLAEAIAAQHPDLSDSELNDAVRRTLDRDLFHHLCEARGIKVAGPLRDPSPEMLTPNVDLPDDILGRVYEQSLGRIVRRTGPTSIKIERTPDARKAGGVYYTPAYIVDEIVRHTVGELLRERTVVADEREKRGAVTLRLDRPLRVCDPACGSGALLLGAYRFLLDWHLDFYRKNRPDGWAQFNPPPIIRNDNGNWSLSVPERRRILIDHIYGVDLDAEAVEVTQRSLLLKLLDGASVQPLAARRSVNTARLLNDLDGNIKCGDSLVGSDFEGVSNRVNPFDWEHEFPSVFADGGFDAVIGNPPYLSFSGRQAADLDEDVRAYYDARYEQRGWITMHGLFIAQAMRISREFVSFIVPDQVGHLDGYAPVRAAVSRSARLRLVRYWGEEVFRGAVTPALVFVASKSYRGLAVIARENGPAVECEIAGDARWEAPSIHSALMDKLTAQSASLGKAVADPGVHTGNCSAKLIHLEADAPAGAAPVLEGKQVDRYRCRAPVKKIDLDYQPTDGEYFAIRDRRKYEAATFVIRQTASHPIVGPREHAVYFRNSLLALYPPGDGRDVRFVVGLLNSRLMRYAYTVSVRESHQRAFPQVKVRSLRALPIRRIDAEDARTVELHDAIVERVERLLALHRGEAGSSESAMPESEAEDIDRRIDHLVYELYGLTGDEIAIIEEATEER